MLHKGENEPDFFESTLLANLLAPGAGGEGVRLVVLGACNSASRDEYGAWTGVAPALVRERMPAVVAMQFRVADTQASAFMRKFYKLVLSGYPVDQAVTEGRRLIYRNPGPQGDWAKIRDWGTPVLYLRSPDGVLFPAPEEASQSEADSPSPARNIVMNAQRDAIYIEGNYNKN